MKYDFRFGVSFELAIVVGDSDKVGAQFDLKIFAPGCIKGVEISR